MASVGLSLSLAASNKLHWDHIVKSHREREKRLLVQECLDGIFTKTLWHTFLLGGARENEETKTGGKGYLLFFPSLFLPLANTAKCLNKHEQSVYFHLSVVGCPGRGCPSRIVTLMVMERGVR